MHKIPASLCKTFHNNRYPEAEMKQLACSNVFAQPYVTYYGFPER
jgi:hypothetical protein